MSEFISRHLLTLVLTLSAGVFLTAYHMGWNLELAVFGCTTFSLIAAITIERFVPVNRQWNKNQGDFSADVTSAFVLLAIVDPLLKLAAPILVIALYSTLNLSNNEQSLAVLPLGIQFVIATLLIEFGRYWAHQAHHQVKPLWRLHALHHSSQRIYSINNLRFHPLNYVVNFFLGVFPAMVLGISPEALLGYLVISQPIVMLQHGNIDLRSGWWNYVFSTNEVHRWHHSTELTEANSNYGATLVLWDQIFGTFRYESTGPNCPSQVGLFPHGSSYPANKGYFSQLCSGMMRSCCSG